MLRDTAVTGHTSCTKSLCGTDIAAEKETDIHYSGDGGALLHLFNGTGTFMKIHISYVKASKLM
jgi:hypothetical protein